MMSSISLLTLLLIVGALAWPFAAGLGVVLWSKSRAKKREAAMARVEAGVRHLYESLEAQPIPPRLAVTVDALQEAEEMAAAKAAIRRRRRALTAE
jgi:Flp pilus assembly protein TadB